MTSRRRRHRSAALCISLAALCMALLPACQGVADDGYLIIPESCALLPPDLLGTWVISHVVATLTCPAGIPLRTTAAANNFVPTTAYRDDSLPGYRIAATGLTVALEDSCHITWSYLDRDTNARYDCFGTFQPANHTTGTTGGTAEAGHCTQVTLINKNGSTGASCAIPSPYLDTFLDVGAR